MLILMLCISAGAQAQNAKQDPSGNYIALKSSSVKDAGKPTGKTFTDGKGISYPVIESARGKLYYVRTSKSGNVYKVYLKL